MAKFAAVALLALMAIAFVAQASAAGVGHTSCYDKPTACKTKSDILKACAAKTVGANSVSMGFPVYGCACFYYYQFADMAAHDAYQTCEKTGAGKALYATVKSKDLPKGIEKEVMIA